MKVELKLYASLSAHLPENASGNSCEMELAEPATVGDLLTVVNIALDQPKILFCNGVHTNVDEPLNEGDAIAVFPPIAGG